jgi:threonine efflux protein
MTWQVFGAAIEPSQLALVYGAYMIGAASPGPSNLAIMNVAMRRGRKPAVYTAFGVLTGAMGWAILAATGLTALLTSFAYTLVILKFLGGFYLLYLAYKSAKSAFSNLSVDGTDAVDSASTSPSGYFRTGVLLHASNPKAILTWVATMSLGLSANSNTSMLVMIIAGCFCIGLVVFVGYALIFSTAAIGHAYARLRRWFDGALALMFGYAGLKLLTSRV